MKKSDYRKELKKEIEKWIEKNGACDINLKTENIHFFNGGLFQDMNETYAEILIRDLDSMIRYLNRLKRFLNKIGVKTSGNLEDYLLDKQKENKRTKK